MNGSVSIIVHTFRCYESTTLSSCRNKMEPSLQLWPEFTGALWSWFMHLLLWHMNSETISIYLQLISICQLWEEYLFTGWNSTWCSSYLSIYATCKYLNWKCTYTTISDEKTAGVHWFICWNWSTMFHNIRCIIWFSIACQNWKKAPVHGWWLVEPPSLQVLFVGEWV